MSDPAPQSQATVIDYSSTVPAAASHKKAAFNSLHWTVFPVKHLQEEANTKIILLHNKEKNLNMVTLKWTAPSRDLNHKSPNFHKKNHSLVSGLIS